MSTDTQPETWTVAEAKAKLGEIIERAQHQGPQVITRSGKKAVVVVDAALWERMRKPEERGSFADFLQRSPLRGASLDVERLRG